MKRQKLSYNSKYSVPGNLGTVTKELTPFKERLPRDWDTKDAVGQQKHAARWRSFRLSHTEKENGVVLIGNDPRGGVGTHILNSRH